MNVVYPLLSQDTCICTILAWRGITVTMFVDEITITATAGTGGNGVVRWKHEKFRPMAGPGGGDGGRGGDVYVRAVADHNQLAKYTGEKNFVAGHGDAGDNDNKSGRNGSDLYIDIPVGSRVTDVGRARTFELLSLDETVRILKGGNGGRGNVHFKTSVNRSPSEATKGNPGEEGEFYIEVPLIVDVGIIGLPNAGKSTLLNAVTNASSKIGSYAFTTLEPHLGALYEFILADIPGLINGASSGKGLGHKFLRHVTRTKMLVHLVSLAEVDPVAAYYTIRKELDIYDSRLLDKEEWIILTKKDLVNKEDIEHIKNELAKNKKRVFVIDHNDEESIKNVRDALVAHLRTTLQ